MKKSFLLVIVLLAATIQASAQDVGQIWLGGTAKFWTKKTNTTTSSNTPEPESKEMTYKFFPEIGYAFTDHWGIGISLGYGYQENTSYLNDINIIEDDYYYRKWVYNIDNREITKSFKIAPFARFSFAKGKLGGFFVDGIVSYEHTTYDMNNKTSRIGYDSNDNNVYETMNRSWSDWKSKAFEVGFSPGVALNVSEKVSLIGKLGFFGYRHEAWDDSEWKKNSFGLDFNNISFGAIVKL